MTTIDYYLIAQTCNQVKNQMKRRNRKGLIREENQVRKYTSKLYSKLSVKVAACDKITDRQEKRCEKSKKERLIMVAIPI